MLDSLRNGDAEIGRQAVAALGMFSDRRTSESLILALADENSDVAQAAAARLAKVGRRRRQAAR